MNVNDIDLDISSLLKGIPDTNVVFYFRAYDNNAKDFFYANGDVMDMGEVLAYLMKGYKDIEQMVAHACKIYKESL